MRVAIIFDNFGPYHLARLEAAGRVCSLLALEINHCSRDYAWESSTHPRDFQSITLNQIRGSRNVRGQIPRLRRALAEFAPDCVFIPGWSRGYSLKSFAWCLTNRVPAVLMSESTRQDLPRSRWKEWLKARFVAGCSAALVGGVAQAEYLVDLGMPPGRIFQGYNAVDNDYFGRMTQAVRERSAELRREFRLPDQYFLASARFVKRKNLSRLLEAYAIYRRPFADAAEAGIPTTKSRPWSLVLLGEGPEKATLERAISDSGLKEFVLLPGFRQYLQLPVYYGLAGAFVHASTSEPWGLVVNEAMASGLPVVVSNHCGCVLDLVQHGRNGFSFDPLDVKQLAGLLRRISTKESERSVMGKVSSELISGWGPSRFAQGLRAAAEKAAELRPQKKSVQRIWLPRFLSGR